MRWEPIPAWNIFQAGVLEWGAIAFSATNGQVSPNGETLECWQECG